MSMFEHTDNDGDSVRIDEDPGNGWLLAAKGDNGDLIQVRFRDASLRRLMLACWSALAKDEAARPLTSPDVEITYPEDGRRLAALKAASEALPNARSTFLVEVAKWILGETEPES